MPHQDQSSHPCERRKGGAAHQIKPRNFLTAKPRGKAARPPHHHKEAAPSFSRTLRKGWVTGIIGNKGGPARPTRVGVVIIAWVGTFVPFRKSVEQISVAAIQAGGRR